MLRRDSPTPREHMSERLWMRDRMTLLHSVCHHHEFVKTSHRGSHETCSPQVLTEPKRQISTTGEAPAVVLWSARDGARIVQIARPRPWHSSLTSQKSAAAWRGVPAPKRCRITSPRLWAATWIR